ncbi:hypothetical protein J8J04_02710 ['Fragaria x ananassa' phyllody phytoplasma]|uniref:Uncharacterized protein n=1 Tax='Fragaria x ananassa' phyllody phytoplasma TaxID=2358428 RepID=A0ABS5K434_9MOLU|nr:hypothetical protein ['Fragaria x ananassa' phyllody phytoplasma]
MNETKQEQKSLSNYHKDFEDDKELKQPSRTKRETDISKPKKTITKDDFEKIKTYVFSEIDDITLLPNNINEEEKNEINKIKNSWKYALDLLNKEQKGIDEYQNKCDNYNKQINELNQQKNKNEFEVLNEIEALNEMLQRAEDYKKILEKRYKDVETQYKNLTTSSLNSLYEINSNEG